MTRNGKIARLPRTVREELNQRLERAETSSTLLPWLNTLPEVQEMLRTEFDGQPVSKQNLSQWRLGGFQEWLLHQEMWARVRNVQDFAETAEGNRDNVLADDLATFVAARFAALLSNWNGEADAPFEAKTRALDRVCRNVVQLQRSAHQAKKDNEAYERGLEEALQKQKEKIKEMKLNQIWAITREPAVAESFGGGEVGRKLAKYVVAVENDMPNAKLDLTMEDITKQAARRSKPLSKRKLKHRAARRAPRPRPAASKPVTPDQTESVIENKLEGE